MKSWFRHRVDLTWGFAFAIALAISQPVAAQELSAADKALLTRVETLHRDNQSRIKTWEGDAVVHLFGLHEDIGKKAQQAQDVTVAFAYDRAQSATRYRWKITQAWRIEDGKRVINTDFLDAEKGELKTADKHINVGMAMPNHKLKIVQIVQLKPLPAKEHYGPMQDVFWPMYYFTLNGEEIKTLLVELQEASRIDSEQLHVSQDNSKVYLRKAHPKVEVKWEFIFDLEQGGNLVSAIQIDKRAKHTLFMTYELLEGVWLPKSHEYGNESHDGKDISRRKTTWTRQTVNAVLPADAFSMESAGMLPGARIQDNINKKKGKS